MPIRSTKSNDFSSDDISLFNECPRCFYLAKIFNIARPGKAKQKITALSISVAEKKLLRSALLHGAPLQNKSCEYCKYRQLVRTTGIENEIAT